MLSILQCVNERIGHLVISLIPFYEGLTVTDTVTHFVHTLLHFLSRDFEGSKGATQSHVTDMDLLPILPL